MRRVLGILSVLFLSLVGVASAEAGVRVRVDIAAQRMQVTTSDGESYNWAISSGRKGFRSPNGAYRPTRLERSWYSRKYGGAMPHAVFFRGGYAIHGTTSVGALGRPASHGCIRLHPANAAKLFALVKKYGASQTRIALNGAASDGLSQFARASSGARSKIAKAKHRSRAAAIAQARARQKATAVAASDGFSQLAKAPDGSRSEIAKAKHRSKATAIAQARAKQKAAAVAASDGFSRLAKASGGSKSKVAKAKYRGKAAAIASSDGLSRLAKASGGSKSKVAKAKYRSKAAAIAKAKAKQKAAAIAQQRHGPNWDAARDQLLMRPGLPADTFGYQPYRADRAGPSGWR